MKSGADATLEKRRRPGQNGAKVARPIRVVSTQGVQTHVPPRETVSSFVHRGARPIRSSRTGPPISTLTGALVTADVAGLLLAFFIAQILIGANDRGGWSNTEEFLLFLATIPGWVLAAKLYGLYENDRRRADHTTPDELASIFHLTTIGTWLLWVVFWITAATQPDTSKVFVFWVDATVLVAAGRAAARASYRRWSRQAQNAVIFGTTDAAQLVAKKIRAHPKYGIRLVSLIDPAPTELAPELADIPLLHRPEALWDVVDRVGVERVIFAFSHEPDGNVLNLVHDLRTRGFHVDVVPPLYELAGPQTYVHSVEGVLLLGLPPIAAPRSSILKRSIDLAVSTVSLLFLLPVFAVIGVLIKLDSRGPVLFKSERVGTSGTRFTALKFRTMKQGADQELLSLLRREDLFRRFAQTHKIPDDPRVTPVGRWLRRASLDELPQLVNVLRGELSLVGPRPITCREFDDFASSSDCERGAWTGVSGYWEMPTVRPGLTGLWQVNGRSAISYEARVHLDKLYVANWSLRLDLLILAKTVRSVFSRAGAV